MTNLVQQHSKKTTGSTSFQLHKLDMSLERYPSQLVHAGPPIRTCGGPHIASAEEFLMSCKANDSCDRKLLTTQYHLFNLLHLILASVVRQFDLESQPS